MDKRTKVFLCSTGLCPLRGRCPAPPHSNSQSLKGGQRVSLTTSGLGKVAERASGARRKLARPAGREGRKGKKEGKEKERGKGKEEKKKKGKKGRKEEKKGKEKERKKKGKKGRKGKKEKKREKKK